MNLLYELPQACVENCPACHHRHLTMEESLLQKERWLKERLSPYKEVITNVHSVDPSLRLGYRDKVCMHAEYIDNKWEIGVRRRGVVVSVPNCPVHNDGINKLINAFLQVMPPYADFPLIYYVQTGVQLTLVLKTNSLPRVKVLEPLISLAVSIGNIEGFWVHLHPSAGKKVFGKGGWHLVFGKPESFDEEGLQYGPAAFQQLLPSLYRLALDESGSYLFSGAKALIFDLYSGTGSSLRRWKEKAAYCLGVEISGEAIRHAAVNVPGVTVLRGTCKQRLPQLGKALSEPENINLERLIYANPPRTGLENEVIDWMDNYMVPERIAYLSCSAGTLRRDLDLLTIHNYSVDKLVPYDFFPNTKHVEVLALLRRV